MECYDNTNEFYETKEKVDRETKELVVWIEETYDCSGLDSKPKFYVSRSVYEGAPKRTCGEPLRQLVNESLVMKGILMLLCSLTNFLIFICNLILWKQQIPKKIEPA